MGNSTFSGPDAFRDATEAPGDLKRSTVRGGSLVLLSQGVVFVLTLGATMILARLLTPSDFGLVAMVLAVTAFATQFRDLGLSQATIQRTTITDAQISTLFWINAALGLALSALTAAAAPLLARYYGDPRLVPITLALAGTFFLSGLGVQHQALLRRRMRFGVLTAIDILSLAAGLLVAVVLAWRGAGWWALVYRQLVAAAAATLGVWWACRWRPLAPRRGAGVRSMLAFGGHVSGYSVVTYFARNLDRALLGQRVGSSALGLYSKAYQLILLPINMITSPLTAVALPALSRLQHDPPRYRSYYQKGIAPLVAIGMPGVVFLFVTAADTIPLFLGGQWVASVPIFRLLAPAAFVGTIHMATGWVYVSLGLTRRQLEWTIVATVLTIAGFFIGLHWGVRGLAAAVSIAFCGLQYPALLYCFRPTFLKIGDLLTVLWRPALASLAAGAACWACGVLLLARLGPLSRFVLQALGYGIFYGLAWLVIPRGRQILMDMLGTLRELRRGTGEPGARHPIDN
jgi:O-antigen/teichoic acid export membrane protein